MFAAWVCKIVIGMALALLGQCGGTAAVKTAAERVGQVTEVLRTGPASWLEQQWDALPGRLGQAIERLWPTRAWREDLRAGRQRLARLAKTAGHFRRDVRREVESSLMTLRARVEAAWNELSMAATGESCGREAEI